MECSRSKLGSRVKKSSIILSFSKVLLTEKDYQRKKNWFLPKIHAWYFNHPMSSLFSQICYPIMNIYNKHPLVSDINSLFMWKLHLLELEQELKIKLIIK